MNATEDRQAEASRAYGVELIPVHALAELYDLPLYVVRRMDKLKQIPSSLKYRGMRFWVKSQHVAHKASLDRARSEELKKVLGEAWGDNKPKRKRQFANEAA